MWTLGESKRSVVRFNTGLMYDQTINAIYELALQNDGTNARASATLTPTQAGAPAFPAVLSTGAGATPNTASTVDPGFKIAKSWQNNVQFEQAVGDRYAVSIGASFVKGYNLPVVTNINLINPIGTLADGLPVFATAVNAQTRVDPRFNVINSAQSIGESTYQNMTLQFTRRNFNGIGFDLAYTLGSRKTTRRSRTRSRCRACRPIYHQPRSRSRPNILDQRQPSAAASWRCRVSSTTARWAPSNDNVFGVAPSRQRHR